MFNHIGRYQGRPAQEEPTKVLWRSKKRYCEKVQGRITAFFVVNLPKQQRTRIERLLKSKTHMGPHSTNAVLKIFKVDQTFLLIEAKIKHTKKIFVFDQTILQQQQNGLFNFQQNYWLLPKGNIRQAKKQAHKGSAYCCKCTFDLRYNLCKSRWSKRQRKRRFDARTFKDNPQRTGLRHDERCWNFAKTLYANDGKHANDAINAIVIIITSTIAH